MVKLARVFVTDVKHLQRMLKAYLGFSLNPYLCFEIEVILVPLHKKFSLILRDQKRQKKSNF